MPLKAFLRLLHVAFILLDLPMFPCLQCFFTQLVFPTSHTCPCYSDNVFTRLRFRTIILFTYVISVITLRPIPPTNLDPYNLLFSFRSPFRFLGQSSSPTPAVPVVTSGRVAFLAVGDTVLLVKHVWYRVLKFFPVDGYVVLQKINTRDGPFKRFISQIWVSPLVMVDTAADTAFPSVCDCPEPELFRLLPDTLDFATQVEMKTSAAHYTWCSLMTDNSSVDRLQRALDEIKNENHTYFDLNTQL